MTNQTEQGAAPVVRLIDGQLWLMGQESDGTWHQFGFAGPIPLPGGWAAALRIAGRTISTPEGCGWTDVAQALPEPQKPVLLDIGRRYPIRAMWVEAKTLPVGGADDDDFGEYAEDDDEWYCPAGWYEWNDHEDRHWSVTALVRRWLPLPTTTALTAQVVDPKAEREFALCQKGDSPTTAEPLPSLARWSQHG